MEVEIRGAEQLEELGKRLKAAGAGDLRKELLRGIREAVKPTIRDIKSNAQATLPSRGGLASTIARSRIGARNKLAGKTVGVRVEAKNQHDIASLDRGRLRHPVYGRRSAWVNQAVTPGWFSKPIERDADHIRHGIQGVMDDVANRIEG